MRCRKKDVVKSLPRRRTVDKVSGVKAGKPNLEKLMEYTRPGDTIVVWKLDGTGHPAVGKKYHSTH